MAHPFEVGKSVSMIDANSTNIWPITSTNNIFYIVPAGSLDNDDNLEYAGEYVNPITGNMIIYSYDTSDGIRKYISKNYSTKTYPNGETQLQDVDINDPGKTQITVPSGSPEYGVITRIENMQFGKDSSIPENSEIKFPAANQKMSIMNVHVTPLEKLMRNVINTRHLDIDITNSIKLDYKNLTFSGDVSADPSIKYGSAGTNDVSVNYKISVLRLKDVSNFTNGNKIEVDNGNINITNNGLRIFDTKNYKYSSLNIGNIAQRWRPKWYTTGSNNNGIWYNIAYVEDLNDEYNYVQTQIDKIDASINSLWNRHFIEADTDVIAGNNISVENSLIGYLNTFKVSTTDDISVKNIFIQHKLQSGEAYFDFKNNQYVNTSSVSQKNIYGSANLIDSAVLNDLELYNPIRISANSRILFSGQWPAGNIAAYGDVAPIHIRWDAQNSLGGRNYWGVSPKDGKSIIINADNGDPSLSQLKYWNHGTFPIISAQVGKNDGAWIDLSTYKLNESGNPLVDLRLNSGDDGVQRIVARQTTYYEVLIPTDSNITRKEAFAKVLRNRFFSRPYPENNQHAWYVIELIDSESIDGGNINKQYVTNTFSTVSSTSYNNNIDTLAQIKEDDIAAVCRLNVDNNGNLNLNSLNNTIFNNTWFNTEVGNKCYKIYTAASNMSDYSETSNGNPSGWILACVINPIIGNKEFTSVGAEAVLLDDKHNTQFPGTVSCKKLETDDFSLNGDPNRFLLGNGISDTSIPLRTQVKIGNNTFISQTNAQWATNGYYLSNIEIPNAIKQISIRQTGFNNTQHTLITSAAGSGGDLYQFTYKSIGNFMHILHVDIAYGGDYGSAGFGSENKALQSAANTFYPFTGVTISDWLPSKPPYDINQSVISTNRNSDLPDDDAQVGIVYTLKSTGAFGMERFYVPTRLETKIAHLDFIWIS